MTFAERLPLLSWLNEAIEIRDRRQAQLPDPQPHPTLFFINDGSTAASAVRAELERFCNQWPILMLDVNAGTNVDELHGLLGVGVVTGERGWAKLSSHARNQIRYCSQKFVHGYRKVPFDEMIFKIKEMA